MVILWDFYETIAVRRGSKGGWSSCFLELLHERGYSHISIEDIRPLLMDCFPWHHPQLPHDTFLDGMAWWHRMQLKFNEIFLRLGASQEDALMMSSLVRERYSDTSQWVIYPDAIETLELIMQQGWRNYIASNFFSELPQFIKLLGLGKYFEGIYTSGQIGYEKPHPKFYDHVLSDLNIEPSGVIMIGDNYMADVVGAQDVGIKAILVHSENINKHSLYSKDLKGVLDFL